MPNFDCVYAHHDGIAIQFDPGDGFGLLAKLRYQRERDGTEWGSGGGLVAWLADLRAALGRDNFNRSDGNSYEYRNRHGGAFDWWDFAGGSGPGRLRDRDEYLREFASDGGELQLLYFIRADSNGNAAGERADFVECEFVAG